MTSGVYVRTEECRKILSISHIGKKPRNKGKKTSEKTKKKQSESHKGLQCGKNNSFFGKKHTKETKQKMREAKSGENHPNWGKHRSEETKQKIREANSGKQHTEESKQKIRKNRPNMSGENAPNWRGGKSFEPYCIKFNKELKERIRERDNRICQECSKTEKENIEKLSVHHIHYDKENCYPDLISLCVSCNTRANGNRYYWEEHFMKILKRRNLLNYFGE